VAGIGTVGSGRKPGKPACFPVFRSGKHAGYPWFFNGSRRCWSSNSSALSSTQGYQLLVAALFP